MATIINTTKITNHLGEKSLRVLVEESKSVYGQWAILFPVSVSEAQAHVRVLRAIDLVEKGQWSRDDARAWA